ncbi:MAG: translocation/assembly module TamB domain-containing protein [Chitinophagaceae bacterium]
MEFVFFNKMNLKEVLVEDRKKDTLLWAGKVQVRITDWFFFQQKADLKYIGLENAVINFNRTDSIWNYQYLQQYFASSGGKKKRSGIEFNLKEVVMNNVTFFQKDAWLGNDLLARVGSLSLTADDVSITKKLVDINNLNLVKPFFSTFAYKGNKPASVIIDAGKIISTDSLLQWNPQNWSVAINKVAINNGTYKTSGRSQAPTTPYFDGKHIEFSKIDGQINQFVWKEDTLRAKINLSTQERSGLLVQTFKTHLRFHPQIMEFNDLHLKTNRSVLRNYFAMKFASLSSMNNFIHAVTMEANFNNSSIASDDLAFFAPSIKNWNRVLKIDGQVKGTVDALSARNINLSAGKNSLLSGSFSIVGLPDINETFINVEANELRTTYADAVTFVPALKKVQTPNLRKLQTISFSGNYTGFINDFVAYGTIRTGLGTLITDLNMKLPKGGVPVYSGTISTNNFQLGQFINNSQLGVIAFSGDIQGRGFEWNTLDLDIDGTIKKVYYNKYTYQNITAKGKLKNRIFDGDFVIKDPNADLNLTGLINLKGATPTFDAKANIAKLDLQALGFTKEPFTLQGDFNVAFNGNSIADFVGNANISNATLLHGGKRLSFDSLIVFSNYINGVRTIRARSNELDADITGKFDLRSLPDAVTLFLTRYYPSYIRPPRRNIPDQSFTFNITTGVIEDYIKLIDKRLSGFNNSHISGALDVASNTLRLDADVPLFSFNQYQFADVKLKGDGNFERLLVSGQVNNAVVSDSLNFPQTNFSIQAQNDVSNITVNTTANQTINQANLSAQIKTFATGATVLFNPSSFVLNGKTWTIEQGGELDFRVNTVIQGQLVLKESNQEINISTQPSEEGNWTDLHIALQKINLGDLSPFLTKQNRIEGLLSGTIRVEDPQKRFNVTSDFTAEQLRVDNDSIGQIQASVAYNNASGMLSGNGNNLDPEHQINFELALDLKDSANTYRDRITIIPVNYPVKILERFIGTLFSDLQGTLTGKLDILGEGANRAYVGKGRLHNAALKVNFSQVAYKIDDTEITLSEHEIDFGRMKLRDRLGNTATVRGSIQHNSFKNMQFDIVAEVDNRPMELLNTSYKDNQQFYGRAMGTGSLILVGPQYDMNMYIEARASETDSSFITLPPSRTRETGAANFMVERKYGREMTKEDYRGAPTNITYEVNLTATPRVNIEVILDELTGDVIKGRGVGNLRLRAGTSEPLSMRGRYDILEGSYLFTFQSFFKKPFVLRPGANNYIEWNGDPYDADIQFNAVYKAEQVSFAPLVSGLALNQNLSRYRGDVNVLATLTGKLFQPIFNFKLEFPGNSVLSNDPSVAFGIQQIEKNQHELNKQVTYLIVFNSFAPYENTQSNAFRPALNELAYSTISGLFFGEVNRRLNQVLSGILRNNELTVNFTGSLYNKNLISQSGQFDINQSNLNISVGKSLFDERVMITLGSTFDVPLASDIQQNIQLFPDVNVEFLINKTGTIRANIFYRQSPDLLTSAAQTGTLRSQRAGANVSYHKEFDSLSDYLFGRKKGKLKKRNTMPVTPQPINDSLKVDSLTVDQ